MTRTTDIVTEDLVLEGPHGPLAVRVYRPTSPRGPGLVWAHGGGFAGGDLDMPEADAVATQLAERGIVVVSVDYQRAPLPQAWADAMGVESAAGVRYPIASEEVSAAFGWAAGSGLATASWALGGASAGANLAAGAALRLRDDDAWQPQCLLLAYPVAHPVIPPASDALAARMRQIPAVLRFLPHQTESITTNYLGGPRSTADGYAMPALAVLDGLCPTLVLNAEYDDLRASGEHFTAALAVAGVDVRQWMAPGMLHGFLNTRPDLAAVDTALTLLAEGVAAPTRQTDTPEVVA